jgi:serine/threonine-protein kinase
MPAAPMNPAVVICQSCRRELAPTALFCPTCGSPRARDAGDDLLGKVLGDRFLVTERIGHGRSGTIYRGEHVTLRRRVAIKVLHDELSRDDLAVERFRREATSVAELDNEHIVEIHDFGRTPDNRLYLAMELLEGETLDAALARDGRLDVDRAVDIMMQVGDALAFAHSVGFVHRDLRPRNVYLAVRRGKANFVKLLDFGLSKLVETGGAAASTSLGMTFGDPRYMSPEQAKGDAIDRRADIYSLGCIGYEMLTGAPPFVGAKVFEVLSRHVSQAPLAIREHRADVPQWLQAAIMRMLAKAPDDRFVTAARMVEALQLGQRTGEIAVEAAPVAPDGSRAPAADATGASASSSSRRGPTGTPAVGVPAVAAPAPAPAPAPAAKAPAPITVRYPDESVAMGGSMKVRYPDDSLSTSSGPSAASVAAGSSAADASAPAGAGAALSPLDVETDPTIAEPTGDVSHPRPRRWSTADAAESQNLSGAWFDNHDDAATSAARARRTIHPGDSLFDEEYAPEQKRWLKPALIAGGLAFVGLIVLLVARGGRDDEAPAPQATTALDAGAQAVGSGAVTPAAAIDAGVAVVPPPPVTSAPPTPPAPRTTNTAVPAAVPRPSGLTPGRRPSPDPTPPPADTGGGDRMSELDRRVAGASGGSGGDGGEPEATDATPPGPAPAAEAAKMAEFYARAGDAALRSGDPVGAAGNYNKALASNPQNLDALIGLGEVALQQGQYGGAIGYLKKAARLASRSSRINTLLGEAYLNSGNATAAEAAFKKALQLDPDNDRARNGYNEAAGRLPPIEDDPSAP